MADREFDNSNSFALFKNDDQREGKRDAEYRGKGETTCAHCGAVTQFWANLWRNTITRGDHAGGKMLSVKVKAMERQDGGGRDESREQDAGDDDAWD